MRKYPLNRNARVVCDYEAARAHALEWLGDRYLLANPVNAERRRRSIPVGDPANADLVMRFTGKTMPSTVVNE
jgi:hypothetical protein